MSPLEVAKHFGRHYEECLDYCEDRECKRNCKEETTSKLCATM